MGELSKVQIKSMVSGIKGIIAVFELRKKPELIYYNRVYKRTSGYTTQELENLDYNDISDLFSMQDRLRVKKCLNGIIAGRGASNEFFAHVLSKKGEELGVKIITRAVPNSDGSENAYLTLIDVDYEAKKNEQLIDLQTQRLKYHAEHDVMTGLYNSAAFFERSERIIRANPHIKYIMLVFDFEHFKRANENLGKDRGDELLIMVAQGIDKILSPEAVSGRVGGDVFGVCLPENEVGDINGLRREIKITIHNISYSQKISYGICKASDDIFTAVELYERAMIALEKAKKNGTIVEIYNEEMLNQIICEQVIFDSIIAALESGKVDVYFQPIYSISSGLPIGAEALSRFNHPVRGMIPPSDFIPVLEKNGFIKELDFYVFRKACAFLKRCEKTGVKQLPVSVNLSRITLFTDEVVEDLTAIADSYGIDKKLVKLEVTENVYIDNISFMAETMKRLKEADFSVVMDDFGSGYSSLNVLADLPIDWLKYDMLFMHGVTDTNDKVGAIITSILRMARWMGIFVVAEGVETAEQVAFLKTLGCDFVQGYFYSKPLVEDAYIKLIIEDMPRFADNVAGANDRSELSRLFEGSPIIQKLLDSCIGGIGIYEFFGDKMEVIRVNDRYFEMFGYTPLSFSKGSKNLLDNIYEEDLEDFIESCRYVSKTKGSMRGVFRRYVASRDKFLYLDINLCYMGGEKNPLLCISFFDVTEEKEKEKKDIKRDQDIKRFYSEMFDRSITAIIIIDVNEWNKIIAINDCALSILECEPTESDNLNIDWASDYIYPADKAYNLQKFWEFTETEQRTEFECRIMTSVGNVRWVKGMYDRIYDENGKKLFRIQFHDITDYKVADIINQDRAYHLKLKAEYDCLTRVYNRATVEERINKALSETDKDKLIGFAIVDIDDFKKLNDMYGHPGGDNILKRVAEIMRKYIVKGDIIGRLGGDEFVMYFNKVDDLTQIEIQLDKFLEGIREIDDRSDVTLSIGMLITRAADWEFYSIYARTDKILYKAKRDGKNRYLIERDFDIDK